MRSGRRAGRHPAHCSRCCARTCSRVRCTRREVRVIRVDSDAQLFGDEPEIHSAFSNLVDNAAKYTAAEGSIEMRWWVDDEGGHFAVTDTGMGIPPEHIPRLTERFYRVDAGRSRATGGSGLGLAIVKHVLQRHGASSRCRARSAAAARFICHFPLEPRATGARATDRGGLSFRAQPHVAHGPIWASFKNTSPPCHLTDTRVLRPLAHDERPPPICQSTHTFPLRHPSRLQAARATRALGVPRRHRRRADRAGRRHHRRPEHGAALFLEPRAHRCRAGTARETRVPVRDSSTFPAITMPACRCLPSCSAASSRCIANGFTARDGQAPARLPR